MWLYRDDELRSDVAVKALADNWAQREDVRERFLEEARILRAADSDHVVRVYDIGEAEGLLYLSMEYVDGEDLASSLRRQAPPPRRRSFGTPGRSPRWRSASRTRRSRSIADGSRTTRARSRRPRYGC